MKLEDQVCSLELAKQLKELGVKQETALYWNGQIGGSFSLCNYKDAFEVYAAFTVAELGEMLVELDDDFLDSMTYRPAVKLWHLSIDGWHTSESVKNEADARAKILIHLIEKGTLKP